MKRRSEGIRIIFAISPRSQPGLSFCYRSLIASKIGCKVPNEALLKQFKEPETFRWSMESSCSAFTNSSRKLLRSSE